MCPKDTSKNVHNSTIHKKVGNSTTVHQQQWLNKLCFIHMLEYCLALTVIFKLQLCATA